MNLIRTLLVIISALYFALYWMFIIFVPYLAAKNEEVMATNMSNIATFLFFHPAVFIGMVVVVALSMLTLGKACALDEVTAARERAILRIYRHKESLAKYVNLSKHLAKEDAESIVNKYVDDILADETVLQREK